MMESKGIADKPPSPGHSHGELGTMIRLTGSLEGVEKSRGRGVGRTSIPSWAYQN